MANADDIVDDVKRTARDARRAASTTFGSRRTTSWNSRNANRWRLSCRLSRSASWSAKSFS